MVGLLILKKKQIPTYTLVRFAASGRSVAQFGQQAAKLPDCDRVQFSKAVKGAPGNYN